MGPPLFPTVFWCDAPEAGLVDAVFLFKFRRIKHLVVAAITELVVRRALPLMSAFEKRDSLTGTEGSNPSPSSGESLANLTSLWIVTVDERNPAARDRRRSRCLHTSF